MENIKPDLSDFRRDWISELEKQRLLQLTGEHPPLLEDSEMSTASTSTMRPQSQSRESTTTLRNTSALPVLENEDIPVASGDEMDIDLPESDIVKHEIKGAVIFATDFGTTFSAAAYAQTGEENRHRVKVVAGYPDDPRALSGKPGLEVPTESWYPDKSQMAEAALNNEVMHANEHVFDDLYDVSDTEENQRFEDESLSEDDALNFETLGIDNQIRNFFWGYGIQRLTVPDMDHSKFNRISRSKLLLDSSNHTQHVRNDLRPIINRLKRTKVIKEQEDVIADYLTHFFLHSKRELIRDGISDTSKVEHVLCVPIVWSSKALRTMQRAMETAIRKSEFGSLNNLFLVTEPEAAAAFVLGKSNEVNVSILSSPEKWRLADL
jgi:hypothetical protein